MQKETYKSSKKITAGLLCITCALILLGSLFVLQAAADDMKVTDEMNTNEKISQPLTSKIAETPANDKIMVIIVLKNQHKDFNTPTGKSKIDKEQREILKILDDAKSIGKAQKITSINVANSIAAEVTPDIIISLAKRNDISNIELDNVFSIEDNNIQDTKFISPPKSVNNSSTVVWNVEKINAPAVWKRGITGKGIIVAVIDTGIDPTNPDLAHLPNSSNPKIIGWIDLINGRKVPYDDRGHGTHVAGTISGIGVNGFQTGVAPGTKLIVVKDVSYGLEKVSDILRGFDWAVSNNARIISFSAGENHSEALAKAIDNVIAAGVIPVVAAGNTGPNAGTVICPGDEINSTTVGATDSSDIIANFSSRGPVTLNGKKYIKPDISAPGVDVISTMPGGGYALKNGTSMATPHVSGVIALMLEKNPSLTPAQIKQILESTAVDLGQPGKDNIYGAGRIDAYKAVFSGTDNLLPIANFTSNVTHGPAPLAVRFTDLSKNANGWSWNFGDKSTSSARNPVHKYNKAGKYTVTLTVKNEFGNKTIRKSSYITVLTPPVAAFSASPTSGKAPLTVKFTDKSTGSPTSWSWNFGDKSTSTARNPIHRYSKAGKYTVKLIVKNSNGTNSVTKPTYIIVK